MKKTPFSGNLPQKNIFKKLHDREKAFSKWMEKYHAATTAAKKETK